MKNDYIDRIAQMMHIRQISARQLSFEVNRSRPTMTKYFRRETRMDVDTFLKIAKTLETNPCWLLTGKADYEIRSNDETIQYLVKELKRKDKIIEQKEREIEKLKN
jgi:transcriptional regulator with XRE-family HTH domain